MEKGDHIELELPMQPRLITANKAVENLRGQVALASGSIIYCFEDADNPELQTFKLQAQTPLELSHDSNLLNGVNIIKCQGDIPAKAIPYYAVVTGKRAIAIKYGFLRNKSQTIPTNLFKMKKKVSPFIRKFAERESS